MRQVLRKLSSSRQTTLWAVCAILIGVNALVFGMPTQAVATPSDFNALAVSACEDDGDCYYKCSGECVGGTRENCFCCEGLCWTCGDSCSVE